MQVQHHVGIAGQALQHQALGLQLGSRRLRRKGQAQGVANKLDVVRGVVAQQVFDLIADLLTEVDKQAIEILPAFQLVAAQRNVHQHLLKSHRIGDGHQHDLTAQAPSRRQLRQAQLQVPGHQHARQLIGMQ